MNCGRPRRKTCAFTLVEVVLILFCLCILAVTLLAAVNAPRFRRDVGCANQLKQMGLAMRLWEGDHGDKYPMNFGATNDPARAAAPGYAESIFQAMGGRAGNPRILVCPADRHHHPAHNFNLPLTSSNLSYFVNPDAQESDPQDFLFGDDNFEIRGVRVKSGLQAISNQPIAWSPDRHGFRGNFACADGRASFLNNVFLARAFPPTNTVTLRLAIP